MKKITLCLLLFSVVLTAAAQADSIPVADYNNAFARITGQLVNYKPDTSAVPNDKLTRKIKELRALRGGFNVNEAVAFMIAEERQKGEKRTAQLDAINQFFTMGDGYRRLNNAAIWIYRHHFNYKELKQLVKFYKTSAGKKMADDFPVIVLKMLAAAEMLKKEVEAKTN